MPGTEAYDTHDSPSNEINSLLEIVINWTGGHNDIDEDGNSPESYNFAKTAQPLIAQNLIHFTELEYPCILTHKIFFPIDEAITSLRTYGTIDHPPEKSIF